jgi:hypothetical protein
MPNQKERKKKGGKNRSKKNQAMRESVKERKTRAGPKRRSSDQADVQKFKPGAADDRTTQAGRGRA